MPIITCCVNEVPTTLNCQISTVTVPPKCGAFAGTFPVNFIGNGWAGEWGPLKVNFQVVDSPNPETQFTWEIDECNDGGVSVAPVPSCMPIVSTGTGFNIKGSCCGESPFDLIPMIVSLFGGDMLPASAPPVIAPPCSNVPPDQLACCQDQTSGIDNGNCPCGSKPGGGPGGPGGPAGCHGKTCSKNSPPGMSGGPINYATGELLLVANDIELPGYGIPWGHSRSFSSRLGVSQTLGQGFNWLVRQWRYLYIDYSGNVSVVGDPAMPLFFTNLGNGAYIGQFGVKQQLALDSGAGVYRLYEPDGSITEFSSTSGMFQKFTSPGGNTIQVTGSLVNGFNFRARSTISYRI